MSKSHEAPLDSRDMDTNYTSQITQRDTSELSSQTSALTAVKQNVNAPAFVPNINAPAFVPSMISSVPAPNEQMSPVSVVPGGDTAPVVSINAATSIQNESPSRNKVMDANCHCKRTKSKGQEESLFRRIETLPNELKFEIFKRLDVEELVKLNLPSEFIRNLFQLPPKEDPETWFANYVLEQNLGYIYIPRNNKLMINNCLNTKNNGPNYVQHVTAGNVNVSNIDSVLEPGFYKLRILVAGFDLCKAECAFISRQCGPYACFPNELEDDWASSYITRGFELKVDKRKELAPGLWIQSKYNNSTFSLGINRAFLDGPVFIISVSDDIHRKDITIEPMRCYSIDKLALKRNNRYGIQLNVMKSLKNNKILSYIISAPSGFGSFDPAGEFLLDEGWNDFCISRYRYLGIETFIGLIISGRQDEYGLPAVLNEIGLPFPDKDIWKHISQN